jgi:hypothetical protein
VIETTGMKIGGYVARMREREREKYTQNFVRETRTEKTR